MDYSCGTNLLSLPLAKKLVSLSNNVSKEKLYNYVESRGENPLDFFICFVWFVFFGGKSAIKIIKVTKNIGIPL
jgi:hypothetical protein